MVREVAPIPPIPSAAAIGTLTPSEVRVLRLLGLYHTDAEIASVLYISRRTASFHVHRLHQKLGTRCRAHLAVTAVLHGLARPPESP